MTKTVSFLYMQIHFAFELGGRIATCSYSMNTVPVHLRVGAELSYEQAGGLGE